jgi:Leucine-rich repeat (LRR) protein
MAEFLSLKIKFSGIYLAHLKLDTDSLIQLFQQYTELVELNLWDCGITQLEGLGLEKLAKLSYLNLSGNKL